MAYGRKTGGKKKGYKAPHTLEAQEAKKRFVERVIQHTDDLFNAQLNLARGITYLYRIDETGEGSKKKREHVLVTDPDEIKNVLDEVEGNGVVDETYYYISTQAPFNPAIDSLMNRAHGTAAHVSENTEKKQYHMDDEYLRGLALKMKKVDNIYNEEGK